MDNNQFNQPNTQGVSISTKKILEYIGVGCAFAGALIGFIFSIVTCARGPIASVKKATTSYVISMDRCASCGNYYGCRYSFNNSI